MQLSLLLLLLCCLSIVNAGLFGLFGGSAKEEIPVIAPDHQVGENIGNDGREVIIGDESNEHDGDEIHIPLNNPKTTRRTTTPSRTTTHRPDSVRGFSNEGSSSSSCPKSITAYSPGPQDDYIFSDDRIYIVSNGRIQSSDQISRIFPSGPITVTAAVYDKDKELMVLLNGRKVYGYKLSGSRFILDNSYPKDLPSSIEFLPTAAVRWNDQHQMLLSDDGLFALYDEYWNKSLMTSKLSSYYGDVPLHIVGISVWLNGKSNIFTSDKIYSFSAITKSKESRSQSISDFFRC